MVTFDDISRVLTARRMQALNDPRKANARMGGLVVAPVSPGQVAGINADYAIASSGIGEPFRCLLEHYPDGESTLRVYNVPASGDAMLLAEVSHTGSDPLPVSLDLSSLRGVPPLPLELPTFALEKMLLAFYYPWYHTGDWSSAMLQDNPAQLYSSDDPVAIARHVDQAKSAGIHAFISSWWGPGSDTDENLAALLRVAQTRNFHVAINFETLRDGGGPLDEATLVSYLSYAISNYGDHPAFLRVDGKPVIVVWASLTVDLSTWQRVFERVEARAGPAIYIAEVGAGQSPDLGVLEVFDGWHMYNILSVIQRNDQLPMLAEAYATTGRGVHYYPLLMEAPTPKIWAATIQPGYDDHLIPGRQTPILPREDGSLYSGTFHAARESNPDWIFITTWNEWWEHTHIEPSERLGDQYLALTREFAQQWGITDPSQAFLPYTVRDTGL